MEVRNVRLRRMRRQQGAAVGAGWMEKEDARTQPQPDAADPIHHLIGRMDLTFALVDKREHLFILKIQSSVFN